TPVFASATIFAGTVARFAWTFSDPVVGGFSIERDSGSGFAQVATVAGSARSLTNSGLSASTTYAYRVRATNSTGPSAYSGTGSVTTPPVGSINVNFALTNAPLPPGYLLDAGSPYGARTNGYTYGWYRSGVPVDLTA